MCKKTAPADAWDDDWETLADKTDAAAEHDAQQPQGPVKLTKAERKAQHAELNRQIWESAENPEPEPLLFLQARDTPAVPTSSTFKPAVTVLSRKPPPQVLSRHGPRAGMDGLSLYDDEDSEDERRRKAEESFAERKARADKEREEKQRKYAEAREKLFGSPAPSSGDSRTASPNKQGRGRGGRGGGGGGRGGGGRDTQPGSSEQSPARQPPAGKQLYDPSYTQKPGSVYLQRKESSHSRPGTPSDLQQPLREPRGPQPVGRGGRGFAPRGGPTGSAY